MIRLSIAISLLALGWHTGGWLGLAFWGGVVAVLGVIIPPRRRKVFIEAETGDEWEKIDRARRGSEIDPTRPDDHPLLLTHEMRRRR